MLKLYLLRHGETDFNRQKIVQGSGVNSSLNDYGFYQAQKFFEKYKKVPFKAIYCSTLLRTYQTIQSFERFCSIQKDPAINELNWGIIEGKPFQGEIAQIYWHTNHQWANGNLEFKIPEGESPIELWNRVSVFFNQIKTQHEGNVLICTHGRAIKILLSQLLGYGMKYQELFNHSNTSLSILHYIDNEHFILEKFNDLSHLE